MEKKETLTSQSLADKGAGAKHAPSSVWPNSFAEILRSADLTNIGRFSISSFFIAILLPCYFFRSPGVAEREELDSIQL
jgi:hypothetical protein